MNNATSRRNAASAAASPCSKRSIFGSSEPPPRGVRPRITFDPVRFSRCGDLPGPSEFGAVNPDAMHDHGQPTR
jgi:hypothetical protein